MPPEQQALDRALDRAFVRIRGLQGIAGAGFLIQSRYILTCAHVVNQALDLPSEKAEKPEATVSLDFPILDELPVVACQQCQARVVVWSPVNQEKAFQDIAVLKILDPCPGNARPISLKNHDPSSRVMVKGFPDGFDDAAISHASVVGTIGRGLIQLYDEAQTGILIQPGFSGAPVWDVQQQAAVGMLVISAPEQCVAQMISVNCLQYVFLALVLYEFDALDNQSPTTIEQAYRYAVPTSWARKDLPHLFEELLQELSEVPPDEGITALAKFSAYLLVSFHNLALETVQGFSEWCAQHFSNFGTLIAEAEQLIEQQINQVQERIDGTIQPHVLISIQPTQGKYHVIAWRIPDVVAYGRDSTGIELWRQTEQPIARQAISAQVCQWVQIDRRLSHSIIEFFLPLDFMDEAVDSWEIEDEYGTSIPLGAEYVVLVRCFDRALESYANRDGWVSHWKNKAKAARAQRNASDVLVEGCLEPRSLFSRLNQSSETIGFHLAKPPDKFGKGSIFAVMLRTAHPVAVWLRESVSGVNCEQVLEAFLQSHPIDVLPTAVKQERSNALAEDRDCHIGHHLSLLWENPHLLPPIVDEGAMLSNLGL